MSWQRMVREVLLLLACAAISVAIYPLPLWRMAMTWVSIVAYVLASYRMMQWVRRSEHDAFLRAARTQGAAYRDTDDADVS